MKRCPECRRDYYDDTLIYCLDDGAALLEGPGSAAEPATAILPNRRESADAAAERRDSAPSATKTFSDHSTSKIILAAVIGVIILGGVGVIAYLFYGRHDSQIRSIAVLPFKNESGNAEVEYLSDGMTETLISSLSQLPNLSVKARSSVFRYKGSDSSPRAIGSELNVEAILNGRLVQRGNDLTLHVELVEAHSENVLWKSDYSRTLSNLVALQNDVARDVAGKLRAKLTGAEQNQIVKSHTQNAEAYRLYLQGRFHWNKRRPEEHRRAVQYFEEAIALDPNYALAYSGIADCYAVSSSHLKGEERISKLTAAANKALELDPTLGEPHAALAALGSENWDWAYAEQEYKKAIELNPNYPTAHQWYAELLTRLGRHDEAISEIKQAQALDPLSLVINSDMIYILAMARRYDEAITQGRRTLEMDPRWRYAGQQMVDACLNKGLFEQALDERERFIQNSDRTPEQRAAALAEVADLRSAYRSGGASGFWLKLLDVLSREMERGEEIDGPFYASVHARVGNKEEAFKWLSRAIDKKENGVDLLKVDPAFDNLRSDPRFDELLRRMNLQ